MREYKNFGTKVIHCMHKDNEYGALQFPIYQTSTFVFKNAEEGRKRFSGEDKGYFYSRMGNPTVTYLENKLADLEGGEEAIAFSSGMGAISATILSLLSCGDHVIFDPVLYGCTFSLTDTLIRFGIEVSFVDCAKPEDLKKAFKPNTKMVYFETPGNPNLKIIDLKLVADTAHACNKDCVVVVDNTFATPYLSRPIEFGVDVVLHSGTKYLNGHGDIIAGAVVSTKAIIRKIRDIGLKDVTGAVMSPNDAFLMLRGLKTLKLRMDTHCANAQKIAEFLAAHPKVGKVFYPGLADSERHDVAKKQMSQFGGVLSFETKGGYDAAVAVMDNIQLCTLAVSLGDIETLIQHPASMTHSAYSKEDREAAGFTDGLIRLAVGLEDAEDLIADLDRALARA
ncbi:MAG: L-methionine gamma-lyase [Desulfovibrio sp.]